MSNKNNVLAFKNNLVSKKDNLLKNIDKSLFINILYSKVIKNIKEQKDVNNYSYIRSKYKTSNLLQGKGDLLRSIKKEKDRITISGNNKDLIKRNVHNNGRTIKAKNGKFLIFKNEKGNFFKVKQIKIPKREFFPKTSSKITNEALQEFKQKILNNWS